MKPHQLDGGIARNDNAVVSRNPAKPDRASSDSEANDSSISWSQMDEAESKLREM